MLPCSIMIDQVTVQINATCPTSGQAVLKSSALTADSIKRTISRLLQQSRLLLEQGKPAVIEQCTLTLGPLPLAQFEVQFNLRLERMFAEYLEGLAQTLGLSTASGQQESSAVAPLALLDRVHQEGGALAALARYCLQPHALQEIVQRAQPGQVQLLQRLLQGQSAIGRVTENRLALAALLYLLQEPQGVRWLSQQRPETGQLQKWWQAIDEGEIAPAQIVQLLTCPLPLTRQQEVIRRWRLPLWQRKSVQDSVRKHAGKALAQQIEDHLSATLPPAGLHAIAVSNAGLVLLWPLLPQLFALLELTLENRFVNDDARWQAVLCLDGLVWGAGEPTAERLRLNQLLCGIPQQQPPTGLLSPDTPQHAQQQLIEEWLTAISHQLPAWQKLSLTDIRQLFLQRPGTLITESEPAQISVQPEPFDLLLRDWPWPLTLLTLPWLQQPLTLIWPFNHYTG